MIQIKDVVDKFEVSRATFHNWKKAKPNLYSYLLNYKDSDIEVGKLREINIVLEKYAKESIKPIFTYNEISFICTNELTFERAEDLAAAFIKSHKDTISDNFDFIIEIYNKIKNLNIVEKYIFSERLRIVSKKIKIKKDEKKELLTHYFREFIKI
ncbi:MAG: hypothetical protein Q8N78_08045 [Sulfurimonas sp.]|nr:hypothetical protein [Sulfurimonas sp.]